MIRESFCLQKTFLFVENLLDQVFFFFLRKTFLFLEKFLDCEEVIPLWESSLTEEKFLDQRKFTFLTAEKIIGLLILKAIASTETIKTYILSL